MAKKSIMLLGQPVYNEDGVAGEVLHPGHLVDGVTTILKQATASVQTPRAFALERDELGQGIDGDVYGATSYAVGDRVKVGVFHAGQHVLAYIASGQNITVNQRLESAGDGTLKAYSSGVMLARALEAVNATALTRLRVEII